MFDIFLHEKGARRKNVRKALTFSLSLLLHALLITAVIVMPLLRAEANLPEFRITDAALIAPPFLPGVPPGPGRGGKTQAGPVAAPHGPKNPPSIRGPRGFLAPVEIPTDIAEEDPTAWISDGPVGPGIDGVDPNSPWKLGDEIKTDEIIPHTVPLVTVRAPRLIKKVNPDYPAIALASHVSGKVEIEASTDIYGRVKEARVLRGHALLNAAALEAVREWIYEPYFVNGIPRPVRFSVTVTFSLETR